MMTSDNRKRAVRAVDRPAPAKITRPVLSGVVARTRLFELLDDARTRPITWIAAPPGFGKTTLVASYLQARGIEPLWYQMDASDTDAASFFYYLSWATQLSNPESPPLPLLTEEYRKGLASFTHNFFREMFARLPRPGMLVLDEYQQLPAIARTHEILQEGLGEIPAGVRVLIISREEPSAAFARLRALERVAMLSGEELRLTLDETAELVRMRTSNTADMDLAIQNLQRRTQGWAAGVVLLTESGSARESKCSSTLAHDQVVFDYFANEIFRHASQPLQETLLKTAFLPKVTSDLILRLTGLEGGGELLDTVARREYFTMKHGPDSYEYHPLFRAFLTNRASETFGKAQLHELKVQSARLLAQSGEIEAAVELLQQEEQWQEAYEMMGGRARSYLDQGRGETLLAMIERFPADMRQQDGWLLYLQGACRLIAAPVEARGFFERAFAVVEHWEDSSPVYYSWIGIVESYVIEGAAYTTMKGWIERYATLGKGRKPVMFPYIEATSVFAYLDALRMTMPEHPDFLPTGDRAELLFREETDTRRRFLYALTLLSYYAWRGQMDRMCNVLDMLEPIANQPDVAPVERIIWYSMRALYFHCIGAVEESVLAVNAGLALADSTGVHAIDGRLVSHGIAGQVRAGRLDVARSLLQRMAGHMDPSRAVRPFYYIYSSMTLLHEGNAARALEEALQAKQASDTGSYVPGKISSMLCEACALAHLGRVDDALAVVTEAHAFCVRASNKLFECYALHVMAHIHRLRGDSELALETLRKSLDQAREMGVCAPAWCRRDDNAALYAMALSVGIHRDYVCSIIQRLHLAPPLQLREHWPWPLRLYTLGKFAVIKDGAPLCFGGKAQHKPLELLRALISCGGRNVSASMVASLVWPDSDGDMARTALETTLHRLRRLLGDKSILMYVGQLSLNAEYCWLDTWAFEEATEHLESLTPDSNVPQRVLDLYQGCFLPSDDAARSVAQRERLRSKFLRAISHYGKQFESLGQWENASALYQQGIEIDQTAEELYRLLMQCYRRLGRFAEAIVVYRRCQMVLAAELDVEPSRDSQLLHRAISRDLGNVAGSTGT